MTQVVGRKIARPTRPLADVNVLPKSDGSNDIVVCFMPKDPTILVPEGSKAFLALDASRSLQQMYGAGGVFEVAPNYVQAVARKLGELLSSVTKSGKVSAIYWAVSPDGSKIEEIGEFDESGWSQAGIDGPVKQKWGNATKLLPALKHGIENVAADGNFTMGVIITDGIIEDEKDCSDYCLRIGKEIADNKRKPVKLILIGIGKEVDGDQLQRFDDLFEGGGIDIDLFSHGMITSMKEEADILGVLYGELITDEVIVAPSGSVEDSSGRTLKLYPDGLPAKFRFTLPKGETEFIVRAANQPEIRQSIV
ncbi:MAG: hypothetical protein U1F76_05435 [Candidatus Competibacteraceae bacterium]